MIRSIRVPLLLLLSLLLASCASKPTSSQLKLDEVIAALDTPDPSAQVVALLQLSELGQEARSATPTVLSLLKSKDKNVRRVAAVALARVASPEEAVPALTAALRGDPDVEVRRQAALSLGGLGAAAESALPELEKFSKEPDRCASASTAIKNIRR